MDKGYVNSWIEQYTDHPTPCANPNAGGESILDNWVVWVIVGLVVGSVAFGKKGKNTV